MPKKKRVDKEYQGYLFSIKKCSVDYSLSLNHVKYLPEQYSENSSLTIEAECISPEKKCGNIFKLVFMGSQDIEESFNLKEGVERKRIAVGSLTIQKDRREFLGSVPRGSFWGIQSAIERGNIKSIGLYGEKLRRGRSSIIYFSFAEAHDPDEW